MGKNGKVENNVRYLGNDGGPILGIVALVAFVGYLILAHVQPKSGLVTLLHAHGSTAQVVSVAVVLFAAVITWGIQKVLFRIRERERLINRNTELEIEAAKVPLLEQRIAELEVLVAELRNQRAQQPPEEKRQ